MSAIEEIAAERQRQITEEGWTPEHDDRHRQGQIARAAATYAYVSTFLPDERNEHIRAIWGRTKGFVNLVQALWPWSSEFFNPKDRRRDLIRAGALIVAEIERLDRFGSVRATHAHAQQKDGE